MLVAGTLDEVAWLLNVRGDDIPNCPLAVAYAVLERVGNGAGDSAKARPLVFVEEGKLGPEARRHLVDDCGAEVCGDLFLVYCLWWADTGRLWAGLCLVGTRSHIIRTIQTDKQHIDPAVRGHLWLHCRRGERGEARVAGPGQEQLRAGAGGCVG